MNNGIDLFHGLKKFVSIYEKNCVDILHRYQINQSEFDILMFLANHPQYNTAKDICDIRGMKSGLVSVMVEKLIKKGYLVRYTDESDRRIVRLFIQESCASLVEDGRAMQKAFFDHLSLGIGDNEEETLNLILEKVRNNLKEMDK